MDFCKAMIKTVALDSAPVVQWRP